MSENAGLMSKNRAKVAVVGAGPCGVAAAIQLKRSGVEAVLIEKRAVGGLLHNANLVENYPGFPRGIAGPALCGLLEKHLVEADIAPVFDEVATLEPASQRYALHTHKGRAFQVDAVVLATGTRPNTGVLPWEETLEGRKLFREVWEAVSYAKGKRAGIVGGGDAAYDYALNLASKNYEVTLIQRRAARCLPLLERRVAAEPAINRIEGVRIASCKEVEEGLEIDLDPSTAKPLHVDFLLVACGRSPEDSLLKSISDTHPVSDRAILPPGIYAGGDLMRGSFRQAGIAVGDGLVAAMDAVRYLAEETQNS